MLQTEGRQLGEGGEREAIWVQWLIDVCCRQHWALGNSYVCFTLFQMEFQAEDMEVRMSRNW